MDTFVQKIASIGELIIQFSWLPLLIWTLFSGVIWSVLRSIPAIHPQYQYHGRLALIFALPVGFIGLGIIQYSENLLLTSSSAPSLSLISVTAPFELTVTAAGTNSISNWEIFYFGLFLFLLIGFMLFNLRNILQWIQLRKLQTSCSFDPIEVISGLNQQTVHLIQQTKKEIRVAFLDEEIIPVTFGLRKPVIVAPKSIKHDSEKLNLVLRHELTHIIQNDFLSNVAISLTQIVFWFHPLIHVLKRELIDYREIRCDSLVLSNDTVSRKMYASLLLELLPMPNINKELSVNMAQESSKLKKRIQMITQQTLNRPIPKRSSAAIFAFIILSTTIAMSCTDMQTQNVFDEEDLNLMTDVDENGDRGFHQVVIFMSDEKQSEKHESALEKLNRLTHEHIQSVEVLKGEQAIEKFGDRGKDGVIVINTKLDYESYNIVLEALGMERQKITPPNSSKKEDHFVAVEKMPELIGGLESIMTKIQYPEEAKKAGIEGRVYVQFIVNKQGDVENAKVIRGIGGGADEEALRVVRQAKFKPGYQQGEPVRVQYSIPIFFQLSKEENQQ